MIQQKNLYYKHWNEIYRQNDEKANDCIFEQWRLHGSWTGTDLVVAKLQINTGQPILNYHISVSVYLLHIYLMYVDPVS